MAEVLVCYAVPLDSDRQGPADDTRGPDHALIFWNDHCAGDVIGRLGSTAEVIECSKTDVSMADVVAAVRDAADLAVIVILGHGECPSGQKRVWNRKREPRAILATEDVVRAAASSGQVFLACFSITHFEDAATEAGVPAFVGFSQRPLLPSVAGDFREVFSEDEQQDLIASHRALFVDFVASLIESAVECGDDRSGMAQEWNRLVGRCKQQLGAAAKTCLRLLYDTRNPHYFAQQQALLNNARALDCLPRIAACRA